MRDMSGELRPVVRIGSVSAMLVAVSLVAGCAGMMPTYGTGKGADEQLLEDLTGMIAIGGKKKETIEYKPRPEIVKPADVAALPPPQDDIITASAQTGLWPESPEARRRRFRDDADKGVNRETKIISSAVRDPNAPMIVSGAGSDQGTNQQLDTEVKVTGYKRRSGTPTLRTGAGSDRGTNQQLDATDTGSREDVKRRIALVRQGDPDKRRYLSEPPTGYRQPVATAPADELGEDERKKEARRRARAKKKGDGFKLGNLWPF